MGHGHGICSIGNKKVQDLTRIGFFEVYNEKLKKDLHKKKKQEEACLLKECKTFGKDNSYQI